MKLDFVPNVNTLKWGLLQSTRLLVILEKKPSSFLDAYQSSFLADIPH